MAVPVAKWHESRVNEKLIRMLFFIPLPVVLIILAVFDYSHSHILLQWFPYCMIATFILQVGLPMRLFRNRELRKRTAGIACDHKFFTHLSVKLKGVQIGTDHGIAWIDDGLLHFEGLETEFAVDPQWVSRSKAGDDSRKKRAVNLHCETKGALSLAVEFTSIQRVNETGEYTEEGSFRDCVDHWLDSDRKTDLTGVYPPSTVSAKEYTNYGEPSSTRSGWIKGIGYIVLLGFAAYMFWPRKPDAPVLLPHHENLIFAIAMLLLFCLLIWSTVRHIRLLNELIPHELQMPEPEEYLRTK